MHKRPNQRMDPEEALRDFLLPYAKTPPTLLVACSGGPDSMALLAAACAVGSQSSIRVGACWVNHRLRPQDELAAEEQLVSSFCSQRGIPFYSRTVDIRAMESLTRAYGIEDAARRERYRLLEAVRAEYDYSLILTGHTACDQAETVLMRVLSGSSAAGLSGIPSRRGRLARPFLAIHKSSLLAYLDLHGIPYSSDSTNSTNDYQRNRLRHELIPLVASLFPSYRQSLALLAAKAADEEAALGQWAESLVDSRGADVSAVADAPIAVRERALFRILNQSGLCPPGGRLSWAMVHQAARALPKAKNANKTFILARGAGAQLVVHAGRIYAEPTGTASETEQHDGFSILLAQPGDYRIAKSHNLAVYYSDTGLRSDAFSWPLVFRSARHGDRIQRKPGTKSLDELLSPLGLDSDTRKGIPVLEDRDGIVAVLGSWGGVRDYYRNNPNLQATAACGFLTIERKGNP